MSRNTRIGLGFDAHRFGKGRRLVLAGVEIPYGLGLVGHSDADVAAHALMDAILGALAAGDIGTHFPPDDPALKDADSMKLLARVAGLAREKGYRLAQADLIIICEEPKLSPHFTRMRERIAEAAAADPEDVSVKASTTEGMGFTGRKEGIAAIALAVLEKAGG